MDGKVAQETTPMGIVKSNEMPPAYQEGPVSPSYQPPKFPDLKAYSDESVPGSYCM